MKTVTASNIADNVAANIDNHQPAAASDAVFLNALLQGQTLRDLMQQVSATVRKHPSSTRERWLLFQLLCIDGDWQRALKQLQTWVTLEPEGAPRAQMYRGLIQAEMFRAEVFGGSRAPGFIDAAPAWIADLLQANALLGKGELGSADALRLQALNAAPATRGEGELIGKFEWLTESDTRLGPVCEMAIAGGYRWLPFEQMLSLRITPVSSLLDLVWSPATVTLRDRTILKGYVPSRYAGSESGPDAIKLGRQTSWTEAGETAVIGLGQKTWSSERGDWAMLNIGECRFIHGDDEQEAQEKAQEKTAAAGNDHEKSD